MSYLLNLIHDTDRTHVLVPEHWGQGRAVYGGLAGALLLKGACERTHAPPRGVMISFVAPLEPGSADLNTRVLRSGRSSTHIYAELVQEDSVRSSGLFLFGDTRQTGLKIEVPSLVLPPWMGVSEMPFFEGLSPEFTRHFEYRWTSEALPFSGSEPHVQGWARVKDADWFCNDLAFRSPSQLTPYVLALIDAWPPPIWSAITTPAMGSSATWQVTFTQAAHREFARDAWFGFDSRASYSEDGYADFESKLSDENGQILAFSRQIFAEFSRPA